MTYGNVPRPRGLDPAYRDKGDDLMAKQVTEIDEEIEEIRMLLRIWHDFYRILTAVFYSDDPEDLSLIHI